MDRTAKATDDYVDKLLKYIPAEVSGLFLIANSLAPFDHDGHYWMKWIALIGIFFSIIYMKYVAGNSSIKQVLFVSIIIFPTWAATIISHRLDEIYSIQWMLPVIAGAVTLLAPVIVKGERG